MPAKVKPKNPPKVRCKICLKEIPPAVDKTREGSDYLHNFCGLDCYQKWRQTQPKQAGHNAS